MTKPPRPPIPTGLRIVYLILGYVTAASLIGTVLVGATLALSDPDSLTTKHPHDGMQALGFFAIAAIAGWALLAIHLLEKASGDDW